MADVLSQIASFYNKKKPYSLLKDDQPSDDKALKLAAAPDPDEEPSLDIGAKEPSKLSALVRPQQRTPAEDLAAPPKPQVSDDDDNQSGKYVRSSMVAPDPKAEAQEPQAKNLVNSGDEKPKGLSDFFNNDKAVEAMMAVLPALAGAALGGLGGAAAGSKAGADTLETMMKDKKDQKKLDAELALKAPEIKYKQAETEKLNRANQIAIQNDDVNSPLSQKKREQTRLILEQVKPGLSKLVGDDMSGTLLDERLKTDGDLGKVINGEYQKQGKIIQASGGGPGSIKQQRFEEYQNKNAAAAGKEFETDKIIQASKISDNSLTRSKSILDNPNKAVTTKDLNLAYTDYMNAVAAGAAATEGKINRELPSNFETQFNVIKQEFGDNDDLRKSSAGLDLINALKENIRTVNQDLTEAKRAQALAIADNYTANSNPKVQEVIKKKLALYNPDRDAGGSQLGSNIPTHFVTVTNGKETLAIDPKHLDEALKDGYKQVK